MSRPASSAGFDHRGPFQGTRVSGRGRAGWRTLAWLLLPLALLACGKKKDDVSGNPDDATRFLIQHNARFNDGHTVRWPRLPVRVFANNIAREDEVTEWARASGGRVTFAFVGSASGSDIRFRFGGGNDVCGLTTVVYDTNGEIKSVDIQVVQDVFRGPQCVRTVVHETGHAIGFLDHTDDGGLMDDDGGSGVITGPVANMIRNLYSLPPGTFLGSEERRQTLERRTGRRVVTIVDPIRR
ncbi:MAG TPA: hypothetical protein VGW35_14055 [Methylomirabilota bacterium]|nr:hypothetical protein [Methylomirabilota bacterium]